MIAHIGNLEDEEMKAAEYLSDSLADDEAQVKWCSANIQCMMTSHARTDIGAHVRTMTLNSTYTLSDTYSHTQYESYCYVSYTLIDAFSLYLP